MRESVPHAARGGEGFGPIDAIELDGLTADAGDPPRYLRRLSARSMEFRAKPISS